MYVSLGIGGHSTLSLVYYLLSLFWFFLFICLCIYLYKFIYQLFLQNLIGAKSKQPNMQRMVCSPGLSPSFLQKTVLSRAEDKKNNPSATTGLFHLLFLDDFHVSTGGTPGKGKFCTWFLPNLSLSMIFLESRFSKDDDLMLDNLLSLQCISLPQILLIMMFNIFCYVKSILYDLHFVFIRHPSSIRKHPMKQNSVGGKLLHPQENVVQAY